MLLLTGGAGAAAAVVGVGGGQRQVVEGGKDTEEQGCLKKNGVTAERDINAGRTEG